jgi:MFS family permease
MNIEEIQTLWDGQISVAAQSPQLIERQRLLSEFKRRGRMLGYEAFCVALGLVFTPLLSVVNHRHLPGVGTPLYWVSAALHMLVLVACTVFVVRRVRRHRALREQAEVSLTNLHAERRDYRWLPWMLGLWGALATLSIAANTPFHGGSWQAVALRLGILAGFLGAFFWHHYRNNLLPAYIRQKEILRQLD